MEAYTGHFILNPPAVSTTALEENVPMTKRAFLSPLASPETLGGGGLGLRTLCAV